MSTFWHILIWACVIWYSLTTLHITVRGFADIREMLRQLQLDDSNKDGTAKSVEESAKS